MRVTHQPDGPGVPLGSTTVKPYRNEATVVIETTTLSERPDTWVTVCTGPSEYGAPGGVRTPDLVLRRF
jgi:hypothetical protein